MDGSGLAPVMLALSLPDGWRHSLDWPPTTTLACQTAQSTAWTVSTQLHHGVSLPDGSSLAAWTVIGTLVWDSYRTAQAQPGCTNAAWTPDVRH
jgi:hypothetical protein